MTNKPILVDKEAIRGMKFPQEDLLADPNARKKRIKDIKEAIEYGNLAHYKVMMVFADAEGIKKVETTIWDYKDEKAVLKNGITVPVHRIKEVLLSQVSVDDNLVEEEEDM